MTSFSVSGDTSNMTLLADGTEVTVDELLASGDSTDSDGGSGGSTDGSTDGSDDSSGSTERQKTVIFDGTEGGSVATYSFRVAGEVERDSSISTAPDGNRFDGIEDVVDGNQVEGVLGKGIDGYRYTGNIVEIDFDGSASVTIDSE